MKTLGESIHIAKYGNWDTRAQHDKSVLMSSDIMLEHSSMGVDDSRTLNLRILQIVGTCPQCV